MMEINWFSIMIGYIIGVSLMWSLCSTIYLEENDENEKNNKHSTSSIYGWNYDVFDYSHSRRSPSDG